MSQPENFSNLMNPQVYDATKDLACGWKWMCQDPCCKEAPWPRSRCSCCDLCDPGENGGDTPGGGEYSDDPCCYNGTCCACKAVAGDAPPLYAQAIGCGRRHICKTIKTLPLCTEQLDIGVNGNYADLPGRPPHTIVCVRATGTSIVQQPSANCLHDSIGQTFNDLNLINPDCDSYNLWVRFKIPLEVIVRDCAGYLYCMKSFLTELVKIPLTARIKHLGPSWIYAKTRIRLCYPNQAEAIPMIDETGREMGESMPPSTDCPSDIPACVGPTFNWRCIGAIANNHYEFEQAENLARCLLDEDLEEGCTFQYTFGTFRCEERGNNAGPVLTDRCNNGNPKLDILVEACVVRLVPGGDAGNGQSPYICYSNSDN